MAVKYVDRKTGETITESVMGDGALKFAYETLLGRTLWPVLFGSKAISALMGAYYDSKWSKAAVKGLTALPGCMWEEAEKPVEEYASFNEFFTRKLKAGARPVGEGVVSPADGRLRLYLGADINTPFPLKGATKALKYVIPNSQFTSEKLDVCVIRLAPVDYHRFHFPCDCTVGSARRADRAPRVIPGKYHSVNPIALIKYPDVYADNERQIMEYGTAFGKMWLVDVGAFGVGTIVQTAAEGKKGEEKGYFKFGGSTVIMITEAGKLKFDEDLVKNSNNNLETRVLCGERIAI